MMETSSSLMPPRTGGRSRFSKALPEPPSFDEIKDNVVPVRKDSLASLPPPPPKDATVRPTASSPVAASMMESPLPPLPASRINSPPTAIPKRKPVGSGNSVKSPPPPQPIRGGDMSPIKSLYSLQTALGTQVPPTTRSTGETTSPKGFMEPSSPTALRKDTPGGPTAGLALVSPLELPNPVSSWMEKDGSSPQAGAAQEGSWGSRPPQPPRKDVKRPTTPDMSRTIASPSTPTELTSTSPTSLTNQSPSQPQLWRRRSQKSEKALAVSELRLASSHGSTAATSQQTGSSLTQDSPMSQPLPLPAEPERDSSTADDSDSLFGRVLRPSASNRSLQRDPPQNGFMSRKKSKEDDLDGFSQYAQELENGIADGSYGAAGPNGARMPEIRCPPTPEFEDDDARVDVSANMLSASPVFPNTPPNDARPLSMIPEDFEKGASSTGAFSSQPPPPTGPLPSLPPRSSSRPSPSPPAAPRLGVPRYQSPSSGRAAASPRAASSSPPATTTTTTTTTTTNEIISYYDDTADREPVNGVSVSVSSYSPSPSPAALSPMLYLPGSVIPAPVLKETQLDCFNGHSLFLFSRNEDHPVGCMACRVEDRGARFTCSHCAARICGRCRDALTANGRDLRAWVEALRA